MSATTQRRETELSKVLENADQYEFIVRFRRSFADDLECGSKHVASEKTIGDALLQQFRQELQAAYDDTGMAGSFEIIAGPCVSLPGPLFGGENMKKHPSQQEG
jgi:hypothetical protein